MSLVLESETIKGQDEEIEVPAGLREALPPQCEATERQKLWLKKQAWVSEDWVLVLSSTHSQKTLGA